MIVKTLFITLTILIITACTPTPVTRIAPLESTLGTGWQCFAVPESYKKAGYVIEITESGQVFTDSNYTHFSEDGPIAIGTSSRTINMNANVIFSLLKKFEIIDGGASATASLDNNKNVEVLLTSPRKQIVFGLNASEISDSLIEGRELSLSSSYYLIRESITAAGIDYTFSSNLTNTLDLQAAFQSAADAKTDFSRVSDSSYKLKETFEEPLGVCILSQPISVAAGVNGRATITLPKQKTSYVNIPIE